jgi:hypothetical protein
MPKKVSSFYRCQPKINHRNVRVTGRRSAGKHNMAPFIPKPHSALKSLIARLLSINSPKPFQRDEEAMGMEIIVARS